MLHGFTGSGDAWPRACVDALATRRRVLLVDLPGHGRSAPLTVQPERAFGATVEALADVLDRTGSERADWIGYSMGARLALAAGVMLPDRVSALVLESGSPGLRAATERSRRRSEDEALASQIEQGGVQAFVHAWMDLPLFASQRRLPLHVQATERERRLRNTVRGLVASLRGVGTGVQPSFWSDLQGIAAPTLLITGARDGKFSDIGREMAGGIPGARHTAVPDAGHAVHLERPDEWSRLVTGFLG